MNYRFPCIGTGRWWVDGEEAFFISKLEYILFRYDLQSCMLTPLLTLPPDRYLVCIKYKQDIFCFPERGSIVISYQLASGKYKILQIEMPRGLGEDMDVGDAWSSGNKIFAFMDKYNYIFELDGHDFSYNFIGNVESYDYDGYSLKRLGEKIFSFSRQRPQVFIWDLKGRRCDEYNIEGTDVGIKDICLDSNDFWIINCRNQLYRWNYRESTIKVLYSIPKVEYYPIFSGVSGINGYQKCTIGICVDMYYFNKMIWLIPYNGYSILIFDPNIEKFYTFTLDDEIKDGLVSTSAQDERIFREVYTRNYRYIGILFIKQGWCLEIDTKMNKCKQFECSIDLANDFFQKKSLASLKESSIFYRHVFYLSLGKNTDVDKVNNCVGESIFHEIMK